VRALVAAVLMLGCRPSHAIDAKPVNDLVPEKYKYKLAFEQREVVAEFPRHELYTALIPKGWRVDDVGVAKAVDTTANGDSSIWLGASCEHEPCVPEDWNAAIDREIRLLDVKRDERGDHRRVVVTVPLVARDVRVITVYWWEDGASEYHWCEARMTSGLDEAAAAFEKACGAAISHT
jgi:hypothetical protein